MRVGCVLEFGKGWFWVVFFLSEVGKKYRSSFIYILSLKVIRLMFVFRGTISYGIV